MTILNSIILFVMMFLLVATVEAAVCVYKEDEGFSALFMNEDQTHRKPWLIIKDLATEGGGNGRAIVIGLIPAVANFGLTMSADLTILIAVMLIGTMVYLCWWFNKGFESIPEIITFALMQLILFWELKAAGSTMVAKYQPGELLKSIIFIAPALILIASIGFLVFSSASYNKKVVQKKVVALATIAVLLLTAFANIKGGDVAVVQAAEGPWYHFYNSDLQKDADKDNDFNFGPSAYHKAAANLPATTAEEADKEFRERLKKDPALGAADMAWLDAIVGTRFIGVFYDEANKAWDAAINKAKVSYVEKGQDEYNKTINTFFEFLDKAKKVEIVEKTSGLDDQMYMNPVTTDKVPDVIVRVTENHKGHFLRYTFEIKENIFTVEYRLECGFQPCNVEKIMGIKPVNKKTVARTPNPNPSPNPSPSPNPNPHPSPDPNPNPEPVKDPSKSIVKPNDDPGPGENTNNPSNPDYSTKDLPTNSNHMTYPEYKEKIETLKEVNETQRVGGDPNTPSTSTPPDTTVHSNAENGTGNGGVDTPTPVSPLATADETKTTTGGETTNSGESISTAPNKPWSGPKD